ncbi:MAG: rhodanese-like domain-containing protein, partial [Polaribacter sp.]
LEEEAITRLSRVGFDKTIGYLKGGFDAWKKASKEYDTVTSITANVLKELKEGAAAPVFDVRKEGEFLSEHVLDAKHTPLEYLNNHLAAFPKEEIFYVHCAGGYRSMIAASILKSRAIHNFINITGGFDAIKESEIKVSEFVCPSTL